MAKASVGALILDKEGRILLMKRTENSKFYQNCWLLPCGKLEGGESEIDGLKREVREETSLSIDVGKEVYRRTNTRGSQEIVYLCTTVGVPKIMEPNKCTKMGYFDPKRLPEGTNPVVFDILKAYSKIKS